MMKGIIAATASVASLVCASLSGDALAQDKPPESYIYATYFKCDVTLQDRADEIVMQLDKPLWDAAIAAGSVAGWGWLAHQTGGQWRRVQYFRAGSIDALLTAQKKVGDQADAKNRKLATEFGRICNSHDDYIWRAVAGKGNERARGGASFSVYYVCDQAREGEADALVKSAFAPMYDQMVADGALKSWGWNEHVVGAQYRRLATITATDVASLMKARSAIVAAMEKNPLARTLDTICDSHADYIWEIRSEVP
ncbi:MAG TPA: hypothetical protein PK681_03210 [Steroidobacteraceae bacterium]|nr:hypothetical protein [Steroidobacteraceae bacterium]HQW08633.1 hypothetical protein [Steroidobacteraceae bacterium]HQX46717.1 hypothetical protein [Steroidobacteraceae bacterium]HQX78846.1 hypothetical protein [Steroidobacteraceae bacterium]HQZ79606.1 hypothetical protein [Steroidobacteraceae bacterium]